MNGEPSVTSLVPTLLGWLRGRRETHPYPARPYLPPPAARGRIEIDFARVAQPARLAASCPARALRYSPAEVAGERSASEPEESLSLDYAACIFCGLCAEAEPQAVRMTPDFSLAETSPAALVRTWRRPAGRSALSEEATAHEP